jgi:hypothetical protein
MNIKINKVNNTVKITHFGNMSMPGRVIVLRASLSEQQNRPLVGFSLKEINFSEINRVPC